MRARDRLTLHRLAGPGRRLLKECGQAFNLPLQTGDPRIPFSKSSRSLTKRRPQSHHLTSPPLPVSSLTLRMTRSHTPPYVKALRHVTILPEARPVT
jgi:hypothetical protein